MSYIRVSNLSYYLPDGKILLDSISSVFKGFSAVIGHNGCGKSTLAKILAGVYKDYTGSVQAGDVYYMPQEIACIDCSIMEYLNLANNDYINTSNTYLEDYIYNSYFITSLNKNEFSNFIIPKRRLESKLNSLSGGELNKIAVIKAMLSDKQFYIFDEPTNHMDSMSKKFFLSFLKDLNKGVIVITHDRDILNMVDNIYEIKQGKIRFYGGCYSNYKDNTKNEEQNLLNEINSSKVTLKNLQRKTQNKINKQIKTMNRGIKKGRRGCEPKIITGMKKERGENTLANLNRQNIKILSEINEKKTSLIEKLDNYSSNLPKLKIETHINKKIFSLQNLTLKFGVNKIINYVCYGGERVAIQGPNGAGKTTLLKTLIGEIESHEGEAKIYVPYFYLSQRSNLLKTSIIDFLCCKNGADITTARKLLARINITGQKVFADINSLSMGEYTKLLLLKVMVSKKEIELIILDEPTNHLDLETVLSLEDMLKCYNGALIVVSHDEEFLANIGIDRWINL